MSLHSCCKWLELASAKRTGFVKEWNGLDGVEYRIESKYSTTQKIMKNIKNVNFSEIPSQLVFTTSVGYDNLVLFVVFHLFRSRPIKDGITYYTLPNLPNLTWLSQPNPTKPS